MLDISVKISTYGNEGPSSEVIVENYSLDSEFVLIIVDGVESRVLARDVIEAVRRCSD